MTTEDGIGHGNEKERDEGKENGNGNGNGKAYEAIFNNNSLPTRRPRQNTIGAIHRSRATTLTHQQRTLQNTNWTENQEQFQLDLLQVIDPAVQAASTLTHIQNSLLIPTILNRFGTPIIQLESPSASAPSSIHSTLDLPTQPTQQNSSTEDRHQGQEQHPENHSEIDDPTEPINHIDQHLISILATSSQPDKKSNKKSFPQLRRILQGVRAFVITPTGFIFTVYGVLVVFWGAALTLILLRWIKFQNNHQYRIWVEICSQILNGLFTIPGLGLLPSRILDWWNISIILHYARLIWRRKGRKNLEDPNELIPNPAAEPHHRRSSSSKVGGEGEDERRAGAGADPRAGPAPDQAQEPAGICPSAELKPADPPEPNRSSYADVWKDDQELVLSDREMTRLRTAQAKLCQSQTWYRPHSSATHYAFPIRWAVVIMVLNLGNSIFQLGLCAVMWGLRYSTRPAWTTATFMALSFSCGITSALLIWRIGAKTTKSKEVLEDVTEALKPTAREKLRSRVRQHGRRSKSFQVVDRIKRELLSSGGREEADERGEGGSGVGQSCEALANNEWASVPHHPPSLTLDPRPASHDDDALCSSPVEDAALLPAHPLQQPHPLRLSPHHSPGS